MRQAVSKHPNLKYALALFAAAFFWGTTFAAQSIGADYVGTFTYLTIRSYIGTAFLLPFVLVRHFSSKKKAAAEVDEGPGETKKEGRMLIKAGVICGIFLFISSALQQYGIAFSSATNASFITTMYVVLVPIIALIIAIKNKDKDPKALSDAKRPILWLSVILCVTGLYLLCIKNGFSIAYGDIFLLLCAVGFSFQIMTINRYSPLVDGFKLAATQFFTVALISTVCMVLFEHPDKELLIKAMPSMIYAGIFSNGIAYTCQIIGQSRVQPTIASLIMCLECVFGTLSGVLVLGERLYPREILGCVLMFAATVMCSIPKGTIKKGENKNVKESGT